MKIDFGIRIEDKPIQKDEKLKKKNLDFVFELRFSLKLVIPKL